MAESGAIPRSYGLVRDSAEETTRAIESALACDVVVSSGGVSAGAYDFVKAALDALGGEMLFSKVAMKPGKPVVLARVRGRLYFGLPGNPVSSMVSFLLFVAPALRKAMGQRAHLVPPTVTAMLDAPLTSRGDRRAYLRVRVSADAHGALVASPMRAQGSGVSTSMVGANGLAVIEAEVDRVEVGAAVKVVLFGSVR